MERKCESEHLCILLRVSLYLFNPPIIDSHHDKALLTRRQKRLYHFFVQLGSSANQSIGIKHPSGCLLYRIIKSTESGYRVYLRILLILKCSGQAAGQMAKDMTANSTSIVLLLLCHKPFPLSVYCGEKNLFYFQCSLQFCKALLLCPSMHTQTHTHSTFPVRSKLAPHKPRVPVESKSTNKVVTFLITQCLSVIYACIGWLDFSGQCIVSAMGHFKSKDQRLNQKKMEGRIYSYASNYRQYVILTVLW